MLNQLQIKRYCHRLQVEFRTLSKICKKLYYKYAPSPIVGVKKQYSFNYFLPKGSVISL